MPHNKIIQLDFKPIPEEERINAGTIIEQEEWFLRDIADCVADDQRDDAIGQIVKHLFRHYPFEHDPEQQTLTFTNEWVSAYFHRKYENFLESLQEIVDCSSSYQNFAEHCQLKYQLMDIQQVYNNEYGLYVYSMADGCQLLPLDSFLRYHCLQGYPYHIGAVIDYHF